MIPRRKMMVHIEEDHVFRVLIDRELFPMRMMKNQARPISYMHVCTRPDRPRLSFRGRTLRRRPFLQWKDQEGQPSYQEEKHACVMRIVVTLTTVGILIHVIRPGNFKGNQEKRQVNWLTTTLS